MGRRHVREGGYAVIEDIGPGKMPHWQLVDFILRARGDLETFVVDTAPQHMYVVRKLPRAGAVLPEIK